MGRVVSVACQGFLVREACVGVLVGGAGFLLSDFECSLLPFLFVTTQPSFLPIQWPARRELGAAAQSSGRRPGLLFSRN